MGIFKFPNYIWNYSIRVVGGTSQYSIVFRIQNYTELLTAKKYLGGQRCGALM